MNTETDNTPVGKIGSCVGLLLPGSSAADAAEPRRRPAGPGPRRPDIT